jgi:Uma2 family endonuclease
LIVEVADTSLRLDRQQKGALYARAGIAEYWIVNLPDGILEVYREPVQTSTGWGYRLVQSLRRTDVVSALAQPGVSLQVADLLPPA